MRAANWGIGSKNAVQVNLMRINWSGDLLSLPLEEVVLGVLMVIPEMQVAAMGAGLVEVVLAVVLQEVDQERGPVTGLEITRRGTGSLHKAGGGIVPIIRGERNMQMCRIKI